MGTRLFELLLAHVDAHVRVDCSLTVDPARSAEVKRYERLGFTEKRFVGGYYREDEDRYVMTRPATERRETGEPTSAPGREEGR